MRPSRSREMCKNHYDQWLWRTNKVWRAKVDQKNRLWRQAHPERSREIGAANMRKSRLTKRGYLKAKHGQMRARTYGQNGRLNSTWMNKPVCSFEEFLEWSLKDPAFHRLFEQWQNNRLNAKLWPSIDRLDNSLGYTLGNMRWVTHSENSTFKRVKK
jgi:hypothetical protein